MRTAISDTNVLLNLAICPGVILLPSSLIILEKPIPGYSNILKTTTSTMRFGVNSKVNYVGVPKPKPKKVHQTDTPIVQNHDTLSNEIDSNKPNIVVKHINKDLDKVSKQVNIDNPNTDNNNTELLTILGLSSLSTLLIVKYIV